MEERFVKALLERMPEFYERRVSPEQAQLVPECEQKFNSNYGAMQEEYERTARELECKEYMKRKRHDAKILRTKKMSEVEKLTKAFEKRKDDTWKEQRKKANHASHLSALSSMIDKAGLTSNGQKITLATLVIQFEPQRGGQKKKEERELYTIDPMHLDYLTSLTDSSRELLLKRDEQAHGSWAILAGRFPQNERQAIAEMSLYEDVFLINLSSLLPEYYRKQRRDHSTSTDEFVMALNKEEMSGYAAIYFSKRMKNMTWEAYIADLEQFREKEKNSLFTGHREAIERNISRAKKLKELEEKLGSIGLRFATEKQLMQRNQAKIFYFVNMEGRDAELVKIRDSQYEGSIDKMLAAGKHNAEDIPRLEHIKKVEQYLRSIGFSILGHHVSSITTLVNEFEQDRKKGYI